MKRLSGLVVCACVMFSSCDALFQDKFDEIHKEIDEIKARLDAVCEQINSNTEAIAKLVAAAERNDFVTNVVPIIENGVEIGYKFYFYKGGEVVIYHGKDGVDGKDGYTPKIGINKDEDGIYYWTLDGEWLLDADGNKIKAIGLDGEDGKDGVNGEDGKDGVNEKIFVVVKYISDLSRIKVKPEHYHADKSRGKEECSHVFVFAGEIYHTAYGYHYSRKNGFYKFRSSVFHKRDMSFQLFGVLLMFILYHILQLYANKSCK